MATVKIKFRPSQANREMGTIYYQITHERTVKTIAPRIEIPAAGWDQRNKCISNQCKQVSDLVTSDLKRINNIIGRLTMQSQHFTCNDIVKAFNQQSAEGELHRFMQELIIDLKQGGKEGTAATYCTTLNCFTRFMHGAPLPIARIDARLIKEFECYLAGHGLTKNTSSFYMRVLRSVYNKAVECGLADQSYPFKHVYTGIDKTRKRAISIKDITRLKLLDLTAQPSLELARDLFMFSFYTRGMAFIDMAHLKTSDLANGFLIYKRHKTRQELCIKWEPCMQRIVDKHKPSGQDGHLLPILSGTGDLRRQYLNAQHLMNYLLKQLSTLLKLTPPLTMYVARHTWASIAKSKHIPITVISEAMGHNSLATTQIYLASLDHNVIDRANRLVIHGI